MKNKIYLDEKLTAADPTSKWISDFVKSDNPKFAGKSKKERIRMALGASYAAKGKGRNEEVESVDEVSMGLLTRYKQKAGEQASAMNKAVSDVASSSAAPEHKKVAIDALVQKGNKRFSGIVRATNKQFAKEEVEELDEISKKTLGSYISKASVDMANRSAEGERKRTLAGADYAHNISRGMSAKTAEAGMKKDREAAKPDVKKAVQRMRGIDKAVGRLTKEETEQIDEISLDLAKRARDKAAHVVDMDYDDLRMKPFGHSEKQRIKFQKYVDKKEAPKNVKEETEQIDELSKSTLASYAKKAVDSGNIASRIASRSASLSGQESKPMQDIVDKRGEGIKKAVKRLAKEEVEELDELSKSTLASYAKKASHDAKIQHGIGKDFERIAMTSRKPSYKTAATTWEKKYKSDARRREAGVGKAIDRLAKEEVEIDEGIKQTAPKQNDVPFTPDKKKSPVAKAGKYGIGYSSAKHLAKQGMKKAMTKEEAELEEKKRGLWDNIHAKRKRGERPARPGEKGYPKTLNVEDTELEEAGRMQGGGKDPCWKGYKMIGTKKKGGREVPNCVPTSEGKELKTFKSLREELNGN